MTVESYIFLAGASRGVGREVANYLTVQSFKVKAMLRSTATRPELEAMGVTIAMADALNAAAVEQALLGPELIQAVVSTIGGIPNDGERADFKGNKHLIDAAVKAGVQKFILVSSIGSGNSAAALPPQVLQTLGPVLVEKEQAENYLISSGLTYTIIRPGGLKSEPSTGAGIVTEDHTIAGIIHRADVAQLVCRCLTSERANNRVLSAVDRTMIYGQPQFDEFNLN